MGKKMQSEKYANWLMSVCEKLEELAYNAECDADNYSAMDSDMIDMSDAKKNYIERVVNSIEQLKPKAQCQTPQ